MRTRTSHFVFLNWKAACTYRKTAGAGLSRPPQRGPLLRQWRPAGGALGLFIPTLGDAFIPAGLATRATWAAASRLDGHKTNCFLLTWIMREPTQTSSLRDIQAAASPLTDTHISRGTELGLHAAHSTLMLPLIPGGGWCAWQGVWWPGFGRYFTVWAVYWTNPSCWLWDTFYNNLISCEMTHDDLLSWGLCAFVSFNSIKKIIANGVNLCFLTSNDSFSFQYWQFLAATPGENNESDLHSGRLRMWWHNIACRPTLYGNTHNLSGDRHFLCEWVFVVELHTIQHDGHYSRASAHALPPRRKTF